MKFILIGIGLIFLIFLLFLSTNEYILGEIVLDKAYGDIDGDSTNELIVLNKNLFHKYGSEVIIYNDINGLTEIYREDFSELKPWKIDTGDVDGDGIYELSVGIYKETIFHQIMDKRPFIYSYRDNRLLPKWRGSRLSRPFTDYTFYDLDNDGCDEIISIEILEDGELILNSYKWIGFGVEGFLESSIYDKIYGLHRGSESTVTVEKDGNKINGKILIKDSKLTIERMD
jgi:hypothetical protein